MSQIKDFIKAVEVLTTSADAVEASRRDQHRTCA